MNCPVKHRMDRIRIDELGSRPSDTSAQYSLVSISTITLSYKAVFHSLHKTIQPSYVTSIPTTLSKDKQINVWKTSYQNPVRNESVVNCLHFLPVPLLSFKNAEAKMSLWFNKLNETCSYLDVPIMQTSSVSVWLKQHG